MEKHTGIRTSIMVPLVASVVLLVDKSRLDRAQWEVGMRMIGRRPNWDEFSDSIVIDATVPETPPGIARRLAKAQGAGSGHSFGLSFDRRAYQWEFVPLTDVAGQRLGHILVMADVTQERAELGTLAGAIAGVGLPLAAVWCGAFHFYIRRLERRLVAAHKSQLMELERRCEAEERMRHLEKLPRQPSACPH